jgi:endonuclease/exonuclease/phosphatase family metal-dependent hydrolase
VVPGELAILSWNIRYGTAEDGANSWPERADRVANVVVGPEGTAGHPQWDLVSIQEAMRFQIDQLLAAAPGYAYTGFGRDDGVNAGEHVGVLYRADRFELADAGRFWLSDTPETPGSTSWGNTLPRMVAYARFIDRTTGEGFWTYTVHLDHRSEASRQEAAELIAFRIESREPDGEPVLLLGDLNATPDAIERRYLAGEVSDATGDGIAPRSPRLADAVAMAGPAGDKGGTFNGWRAGIDYGPAIDAVLVSRGARVIEARVDREMGVSDDARPASDHHPVFARVVLN